MRRYELTTRRTVQPRASRLHGNTTTTTSTTSNSGTSRSSPVTGSTASSLMADIRRDMLGELGPGGLTGVSRSTGGVTRSTGAAPNSYTQVRRDITEMGTPKQRDIQQDMEDQLNLRKEQWENNLDNMQKDFFNESQPTDFVHKNYFDEATTKRTIPINTKINPNDAFDLNLSKSQYGKLENGNNGYLMHFRVQGYLEEDLSIDIEGRTVTLTAVHSTTSESGSTNKKTISRKVDLPSDVDADSLCSHLSDDSATLTLEAAVKVASQISSSSSSSVHSDASRTAVDEPIVTPAKASGGVSAPPSYSAPTPTTFTGEAVVVEEEKEKVASTTVGEDKSEKKVDPTGLNGYIPYRSKKLAGIQSIEDEQYGEMFKLVMEIGRQYKAEDVKVHLLFTKFTIKAKSETLEHGCRSINKWTRDFNVSKKVNQLRAFMEDGCIHVFGVYDDCKQPSVAMATGKSAVPISAVECEVVMQQ